MLHSNLVTEFPPRCMFVFVDVNTGFTQFIDIQSQRLHNKVSDVWRNNTLMLTNTSDLNNIVLNCIWYDSSQTL